jgi:S1-C subfamily serine protease
VVTNAHVVSGTSSHRLVLPDGSEINAPVVYFDPERDVALLYAPDYAASLAFAPASRGTDAAVIGYPGGGAESVSPAVVDGVIEAQGYDIYSANRVTRQIYVIQGTVRPGNSGGPLIDLKGRVLGIVFATSASDPNQAYALTNDEIASDLQGGQGQTSSINTAQYACAA